MDSTFEKRALQQYQEQEPLVLFHGTTRSRADVLLAQGKRGRAPAGANRGLASLLNATTHPDNALWFAQQSGDGVVLQVTVPAALVRLDPEDGAHDTVLNELQAAANSGLPASVAIEAELGADAFLDVTNIVGGDLVIATPEATTAGFTNSIDSPNFRAWFARSQAVASDGMPLTLYHGTPQHVMADGTVLGDVTEFDRLFTVHNLRGRLASIDNVGSWFSNNPSDDGGAGMYASGVGAIYPVHLSIQNPFVTTFAQLVRRMHELNGDNEQLKSRHMNGRGDPSNLRTWLRDSGYDGIKVVHDPKSQSTEFAKQDGWIALHAHQVKSSIGNGGQFDPLKTDIRFSLSDDPTSSFEESPPAAAGGVQLVAFHGGDPDQEITAFELSETGVVWFSSSRQYAEFVSMDKFERGSFKVYEVQLSLIKPLDLREIATPQWDQLRNDKRFVDKAKDQGYDGVILNDENGGISGVSYAVFDPQQAKILSVFNSNPLDVAGSDDLTSLVEPTATIEFKRWFGGSRVVDAQGMPLVVYHGSVNKGVTVFDANVDPVRPRSGPNGTYFTSDHGAASNYVRRPGVSIRGERGGVTAAYLRLENPLDITVDIKRFQRRGMTFAQAKAKALEALDRNTHDGVIFRGNAANSDEYVAFSPEQIKSVSLNTGAFDLKNSDIRFSEAFDDDDPDNDHALALEETGFWGRLGAGSVVLARDTGRLLLNHRSDAVLEPDTWGTWGGAVDQGENPADGARRELREECGLTQAVELIPLFVFSKGDFRYHNFLAVVDEEFTPALNWESQGFDWVTLDSLPERLHPGLCVLMGDAESVVAMRNHGARISAFLPLQKLLDSAPTTTLGTLPPEATFSTLEYSIEAGDMPELSVARAVFKDVPATFLEIPVDVIKAATMALPDIGDSFVDFDAYHRWYMGAGDVPTYSAEHRWPCIASLQEDELIQDGSHRLHAYIEAGHVTIPVLRYDFEAWWEAHERWKQSKDRQHDSQYDVALASGTAVRDRDAHKSSVLSGEFDSAAPSTKKEMPSALYHGSPSETGFLIFDELASMDGGIYFTPDKALARSFTRDEDGEYMGTLFEARLDLRNPKTIDLHGKQQPSQEAMRSLYEAAKQEGHDGAVLLNVLEFNGSGVQYVAFSGAQIQSKIVANINLLAQPAFAKWFGKSVAVREEGEPLMVVHATGADFSVFDPLKSNPSNRFGPGLYFTTDPKTLDVYATTKMPESGGRLMPVYLQIHRPQLDGAMTSDQVEAFFSSLRVKIFPNGYDATADHLRLKARALDDLPSAFNTLLSGQVGYIDSGDWLRGMDAIGIDGIVREVFGQPEYVVFKPEQVKSAIGNNGEFDPANPDIRFSLAEAQGDEVLGRRNERFQSWFGQSKIVDADGKPLMLYHGTTKDFPAFRTGSELGAHFGTIEQANSMVTGASSGENIKPVYLNIVNPLRLEDRGDFSAAEVADQLMELGIELINGSGFPSRTQIDHMGSEDGHRMLQSIIKANGYDGIVYLNRREGLHDPFGPDGMDGDELNALPDVDVIAYFGDAVQDSYIVFDPEQVKSALGNSGEFDPSNADIRFSECASDPENAVLTMDAVDAFGDWFGHSQVVNYAGHPLVVYHGSTEKFTVFSKASWGPSASEPGFFFTSNREQAQDYGDHLMPVYLQMENPLIQTAEEWGIGESCGGTFEAMRARGHDGIIVRNYDSGHGDTVHDDTGDMYIVFEPNQIKSANLNNGAFDRGNPDIRFSLSEDAPLRGDDVKHKKSPGTGSSPMAFDR